MTFGEEWRKAETNDYFEPPRGVYQIKIVRGVANLSNAGDPKANVILEITEGEHAGQLIDHFMWMAHEVSRAINKEALLAYGLNDDGMETIEDLDDRIQELIGRTAEISVSYKDGRMNIRVSGSRAAPTQQTFSDIPSDMPAVTRTVEEPAYKPAASFADAAKTNDDVPF